MEERLASNSDPVSEARLELAGIPRTEISSMVDRPPLLVL
jgi:hypothetical protein